ncbi:MAG TPA: arginyl aminopeptidase, partial [Chryseosolibacter sp.]|nr:arginyl aminopeptidase [Chryseosolibacter sp.]
MRLRLTVLGLAIASCFTAFGQDPVAQQYGSMITPADLEDNLTILASDALEGRETGKRGQKMAAAFVKAHFEQLGLIGPVNDGYYQTVELYTSVPANVYVKAGNAEYKNFEDVIYYGSSESNGEHTVPAVFVGKGSADEFAQVDVTGKAAIILLNSDDNFRGPMEMAREKGAKVVMLFNPVAAEFKALAGQFKSYLSGGRLSVEKPQASAKAPVFFIAPVVAEKILSTTVDKLQKLVQADAKKTNLKKVKAGNVAFQTKMDISTLKTENVLGFLEGSDKKDELIIITA